MAWSYIGGSSFSGASAATATPAYPAGVAEGDIAFIVVTSFATTTFTTPTGFTLLRTATSDANMSSAAFYRVLTTSNPARAVTWTAPSRHAGQLTVFRGVDALSPIDSDNVRNNTATSTAATTTSLTPTTATGLAVVLWTTLNNGTGAQTITTAAGYTTPTITGGTAANPAIGGATNVRQALAGTQYKELSSTAAENPSATLGQSATQRNFLILLRAPATTAAGAGTGSTVYSGTGTGARPSTGTGSGTTTWTGTATGSAPTSGTGTGTTVYTGTGTGGRTSTGAGAGTTVYTGTSIGARPSTGAGTGTTVRTGTATGSSPRRGTGAGATVYGGVADTFTRANGALGSNWVSVGTTTIPTTISNGQVVGGTGASAARYTTPMVSGMQHSTLTWVGGGTNGPAVAMPAFAQGVSNSSAGTWYALRQQSSTNIQLASHNADGTATTLVSTAYTLVAGDRMRVEYTGTVLRGYINDVLKLTYTPATPITGQSYVGFWQGSSAYNGVALFDNWAGGPLSVATGVAPTVGVRSGSGSGTTVRTGTATGARPSAGSAFGFTIRIGTATGTRTSSGGGTGSTVRTGTATGVSTHSGTGSGATVYTGTGTGALTRSGSGTGTTVYTGTAAGIIHTEGSGVGTTTYTGTAAGVRISSGGGSGSTVYTSSATGLSVHSGSGEGTRTYVGTATGRATYVGAGVGLTVWEGTATGEAPSTVGYRDVCLSGALMSRRLTGDLIPRSLSGDLDSRRLVGALRSCP